MKNEVKEHLISLGDPKLLEFQRKLNINYKNAVGIKIPVIKDYAKKLSNKYELSYLYNEIDNEYYEEILLKGFLIGSYNKLELDELINYIELFVPLINDWSVCDTFVSNLKITKKYKDELFSIVKKYSKSNKEFYVRFSLIMLLDYYVSDEYLDEIFNIINSIKIDDYYVKMGIAWLLSVCFVKHFDKTLNYFKSCSLDNWTYNKTISKCNESYRISKENKELLKSMKRG